jgi:uncharacterized protein YciI
VFLLLVSYNAATAEIDRLLPAHVEFLDARYADGTFLLSGRQVPRTGGFILAAGDDLGAIERSIATDPFVTAGAAHYTVVQIQPTKAAPAWAPVLRDAGVALS